jgi:hypothetical protein
MNLGDPTELVTAWTVSLTGAALAGAANPTNAGNKPRLHIFASSLSD